MEHNSFLRSSKPEQKLQDPERIYEIVRELLIKQQKENGLPDGIGEIPLENGKTCAELLQGVGAAASGYGVVTHFYLQKKDQIPKDAVRMTTISDYIAMRLCENTVPVIGLDMAASWGRFDLRKQEFLYEALEQFYREAAETEERLYSRMHEQYEQMCQLTGKKATRLTGSGNGIRRNSLMRRLAEEMFKMPMEIPEYEEEAAYGAALTAGKMVNIVKENMQ